MVVGHWIGSSRLTRAHGLGIDEAVRWTLELPYYTFGKDCGEWKSFESVEMAKLSG